MKHVVKACRRESGCATTPHHLLVDHHAVEQTHKLKCAQRGTALVRTSRKKLERLNLVSLNIAESAGVRIPPNMSLLTIKNYIRRNDHFLLALDHGYTSSIP